MTVGHEIARRTGLRLFHNHLTIEPVLRFFEFGSPPFKRLVEEFRTRVFEEVAASDLPGLIFTYVWAFERPDCAQSVDGYAAPFLRRGGSVRFLELVASRDERLRRNETEFRLAEKPSKRDVARSRQLLLDLDAGHRLHSTTEFDGCDDYLLLDNTRLTADEVAGIAIDRLRLG